MLRDSLGGGNVKPIKKERSISLNDGIGDVRINKDKNIRRSAKAL